MAQPRIGAQRAQERVLEDVLGVLGAGHSARVREQLVAVRLDEAPERGECRRRGHTPSNAACGCDGELNVELVRLSRRTRRSRR